MFKANKPKNWPYYAYIEPKLNPGTISNYYIPLLSGTALEQSTKSKFLVLKFLF